MYESYYNLTGKPFPLRPDARFFFPSQSHKRAMAYLQYGIEQGEGFIVITGDIGTGKTTLVQNLFSHLDRSSIVAAQLVTTQLEAEDLLRMVAASFNLDYEGLSKVGLLKSLESFFSRCVWDGRRALLVIDEAQNMPSKSLEELRMLSNFQVENVPVLQTFLLGQKEFNKLLHGEDMEQLRQRIIASYQLKALGRDEVKGYIEHRLSLVGWQGKPQITEEAYDLIHVYSTGIPRRINTLCDRMLLYGYLEEISLLDASVVGDVIKEFQEELGAPQAVDHNISGIDAGFSVGSLEHRVQDLEEKVSELEDALQLERARLRALTLNGK